MSICLCMIVKDEAGVIERCLLSVRDLIDHWVICDTGSSDGTQELIRQTLADVPGELHERPWVDFGHNRSESMTLARGKADFLLLLDADMTVSFDRAGLKTLEADSYMLRQEDPGLDYRNKRLVRADREWRYVGSTHEYLANSGPERVEPLDAIVVHHHVDGGSRADKFTRDLELLTRDLEAEPDNPRTVFYLAQTYRDLGQPQQALELYERRAAMGGWEEEVFYALYQVGLMKRVIDGWPAAVEALIAAWEYRPARIEPLYELAAGYRELGGHHAAHLFAARALDRPQPDDILFVQPWIYRWGVLFEYSVSAYYAGSVRAALNACDRLLRRDDLPDNYREQTIQNREFCQRAVRGKVRVYGMPTTTTARREHGGEPSGRSR